MKAILILNVEYISQLNLSATIVAELDESILSGDEMCEVSSQIKYQILERGFTPTRSSATKDRLTWSREASLSLAGDVTHLHGRILVASHEDSSPWLSLQCTSIEAISPVPIGIPIVGRVNSTTPAVAVVHTDRTVDLVTSDEGDDLDANQFVSLELSTPDRQKKEVSLQVSNVAHVKSSGQVIKWNDVDEPLHFLDLNDVGPFDSNGG